MGDGRLAVIGVMYEEGRANRGIQEILDDVAHASTKPKTGTLDIHSLLPEKLGYYHYLGSLTTPPCSEGVLWMVMKQAVQIAPEQIAIFSKLYPMNARPLQAASGRLIKGSSN